MSESAGYESSAFPGFWQQLTRYFPGALPLRDYMKQTSQDLSRWGFNDGNTLGVIATCRDEITSPLRSEVIRYWGKSFDFSSFGGFVLAGRTGVTTILEHTPTLDGIGHFVFYAMPHIAISEGGEVGSVYREGIKQMSHACGSLNAIIKELNSGYINFQIDPDDVEQCIIRQRVISAMHYGDILDLIGITKLACVIIAEDVKRILTPVDPSVYNYAVFTGILIHGPRETEWIYPQNYYKVIL